MACVSVETAGKISVSFYAFILFLNITAIGTILVFPYIFRRSSLSHIITSIHVYDGVNSFITVISYQATSGSFLCGLGTAGANCMQLCTFVWITILCLKLGIILRPKVSFGRLQSRVWDKIGSSWLAHAAIFSITFITSMLPLMQLGVDRVNASIIGPYCFWSEPTTKTHELWVGLTFTLPGLIAVVMSVVTSTRAFQHLARKKREEVSTFVRQRFRYFFLYPISMLIYIVSRFVREVEYAGIAPDCAYSVFLVIEGVSTIGYTLAFWLIFRGAIKAWRVFMRDWWYGENRMAEYLERTYGATETTTKLEASAFDFENLGISESRPSAVESEDTRNPTTSNSPMHDRNSTNSVTVKVLPSEQQLPSSGNATSIVQVELESFGGASP
jgi:hypothetical protein